jgi:uncharacterized protein DUF2442
MMMPSVVSAEYEDGYRIRLSFSEGTVKTVDFRKWLNGPVFEPLKIRRTFGGSSWMPVPLSGQTGRT